MQMVPLEAHDGPNRRRDRLLDPKTPHLRVPSRPLRRRKPSGTERECGHRVRLAFLPYADRRQRPPFHPPRASRSS